MKRKFFLLNLGCPKNLVDSEKLSAKLLSLGLTPSQSPQDADIVIVNTCSFINSARRMTEYYVRKMRKQTRKGKLIVTGCYPRLLGKEKLPSDFATVSIDETAELVKKIFGINGNPITQVKRVNTLSKFSAYLKISEGCSRLCTFCSIPKIRGPIQSFDENEILDEAKYLAESGVKELIIISQDTTMWNIDRGGKRENIFRLLDKISEIDGIEWIRLFYIYPDRFSLKLIDYMEKNPKIVRYLEMPFQHVDDRILSKMARATREKLIYEIMEKIKSKIPDTAIRTELIVGFPGETEESFRKLLKFVEEFEFDWLGIFEFSPEKDTPSYRMWKENPVSKEIIKERKKELMELWSKIFYKKQKEKIGKTYRSIYQSDGIYRAYFQAPEIDGVIKVSIPGKYPFEYIKITGLDYENLLGVVSDRMSSQESARLQT